MLRPNPKRRFPHRFRIKLASQPLRAEAIAAARNLISYPVGRAVQAAACEAAEAGAIPARDSISSGIGVDRHTSVFQTEVERALLSCPSTFRDANTGAGQNFTGLTAAVQLRLRVAVLADGHQGCKL